MSDARKKVFVGLSGGVDSSVAALLLARAGYDVTGVFIKIWQPEFLECNWPAERLDAMRVAAHLGVPFETLDLSDLYRDEVVAYLLREYRAGRTPNPDVACNRSIKFGAFLTWAKEQGADFVATGHYARKRERARSGQTSPIYELLKARDENKDQTYFLWTFTQDVLAKALFPVGEYTKPEVRTIAAQAGLSTAEKKDSQGICFIGKLSMKEFLKNYIKEKPGDVLDEEGHVIGEHDGAAFFTLGERHGFRVRARSPEAPALYVVAKDIEKNILTVARDPRGAAETYARRSCELTETNWISEEPREERNYEARARYRAVLSPCRVEGITPGRGRAAFDEPQTSLVPGQSLVVYENDVCLGGGVIG